MNAVELDQLTKSYGAGTTIGPVCLEVAVGEMLSLLGASGCGKTTVLRMIAGFVDPTAGRVRLRGIDVTHTPPHRRGAALMFQSFALFPHLSVFDNIAFGPRRRGTARAEISRRVDRLVAMLHLQGLTGRLPAALSGGQQQRVALARALAIEPAVVLLDEPFSSLDAMLRESTRQELRALQRELGFTAIMVTHDQSEALSISDRIAVMQAGRLEQVGTPQQIYYRPATRFVAGFVGKTNAVAGGVVRPESIRVVDDAAPDSVSARVVSNAFLGDRSEIVARTEAGAAFTLFADGQAPLRHPIGSAIHIAWPAESVITFGDDPS
jgi:putative spermidine/putrescine transport system ATP-binding protein